MERAVKSDSPFFLYQPKHHAIPKQSLLKWITKDS